MQPNYVPTLEDEIEMERTKLLDQLKADGKKGTPVNPETFAAWKERKRLKRQAEAKKAVETELRKKKGGKGLSVLTGRDLFDYKRDLFKDKDGDDDAQQDVKPEIRADVFLEGDDDDLDDLEDD